MRTAALFAIAVLFASAVRADAPKPEDWYVPQTYVDKNNVGELYIHGNASPVKVRLDGTGKIVLTEELEKMVNGDYRLRTALGAVQMALKNTKQIQTLGQNLNDLLVLNGFKISRPDGGVYTVRFGDGSQSIKDVIRAAKNGEANATSDQRLADGFTVDWRIDGSGDDKKYSLQLKGANNIAASAGGNEFWNNYAGDYYLPMIYDSPNNSPNNDIRYFKFGGIDLTVLEAYQFKNVTGKSLTLKNWQDSESREGISMSRLLTEADENAATMRRTRDILVRTTENGPGSAVVGLSYIPIGDVISGLGLPPDGASIEDHIEGNTTNLAIKGWYVNAADEGVVLADLMTSEKSEGAQSGPTYHVLLRKLGEGAETNSIAYASLGDLHKMSWSTNWYNAVKDIAEDRATAIVNWNTNWVYLAGEIAKSKEATERYVDNALNWSTNWFASTTAMNASQAEIKKYIDGQLDIITNALNAIESAKASVTSINNVKQYIDSVMDYQTNVIIATERAKTSGAIESTQKLVNDTFDILTNELFKVKAYIKESADDYTDTIRKYFSAKMDDEIARIREIEKVVYAKDTNDVWQSSIPNVTNVAQYTQSAMEYETSLVAALEQAKTNGSIRSTQEFVGETFELITNKLNCIHGFATNDVAVALGLTNVANYVKTAFELESAATVAAKSAETNGSIVSIHDFVDEAFELITNKLHGIHSITGNVELAGLTGITNTAAYVSAALEVETNVVVAAKLAETNGSIRSISELVDDTFVLVTNRLNGIHGIVASGEIVDITNTAGYVDALMAIETNVVVATKLAESNGSIRTVHEFVGETYDILTNKLYAIHDAIDGWPEPEKDEIDLEITNVAKYVQREMDFSTNLVIMTDKYVPVEMSIWVTNMYENLQSINNWNVVSNFFFAYFGGLASSTEGGEGDIPKIDPKDDPYSGDYEETEIKDAMLPVKNARNIVAITNTPLEMIKAEHVFDFDVIDTNCVNCAELGTSSNVYYLAQIRGFRNANASTGSKIPVKRKQENIQRPDDADYDLETTSGYGIDWMDYPDALLALSSNDVERVIQWMKDNNVTNIFNVVASNADVLARMSTNLFSHVKAETLLDHETIWTNGACKIEIKGYEHCDKYTSPFVDWGEVTNIVDRGWYEDHGWYEYVIDPATVATNEVWHENMVWITNWVTEVTEDKIFGWEKLPIADSEAIGRFSAWTDYTLTSTTNLFTLPGMEPVEAKVMSLYGFADAVPEQVPYKFMPDPDEPGRDPTNLLNRLSWKYTFDRAIKFKGTDGSNFTVGPACNATNTVTFASAADSNVQVHVEEDQNDPGSVTITFGVYYLNNAGVTPPYVE